MKMETEEFLRSSVNHGNGDGRILTLLYGLWKRRRKNPYVLVWTVETETEDSLRSSVDHGNGDGRILTF